jgi:hypothetical protein
MAIKPDGPEAHLLAGHSLQDLGRLDEAETAFAGALRIKPHWADALEALAYLMEKTRRYDAAEDYLRAGLEADPRRSGLLRLAGDLKQRKLAFAEAERDYRAALAEAPDDPAVHDSLALALTRLGRTAEALPHLERAVSLRPDNPISRYSLGLVLLASGRLAEGWPLFAARHDREVGYLSKRPYSAPLLRTGDIRGKRILAWTDQGIGEEILFAGLVPDLLARGAVLTLECDPRLAPLFARSFPEAAVVPRGDRPPPGPFDAHIALADTARWLRPDWNAFPRHAGYLRAEAATVERLRRAYGGDRAPLIGIAWQTRQEAKISAQKTLPLAQWAPLLHTPGVRIVSLQYGECAAEIREVAGSLDVEIVHDPEVDPRRDLDGFAAQVKAMDAVVSISNATAHAAGALGVPAWTLVPTGHGALWHWFLDRDDSPWYPALRLVRQAKAGSWDGAIDRAAAALAAFLHSSPARP